MTDLMVMKKTIHTTMSGVSSVKSVSSFSNVSILIFFNSISEVISFIKSTPIIVIEINPTEFIIIDYNSFIIQNACIGTSIKINGPPVVLDNKYFYPSFTMSTVYQSIITHLLKSIKIFNININAVLPLTEVKQLWLI